MEDSFIATVTDTVVEDWIVKHTEILTKEQQTGKLFCVMSYMTEGKR